MTLEDAKTIYEKSVPNYQSAPGLVRKYYLFGQDHVGGGVYLWQSREAAEKNVLASMEEGDYREVRRGARDQLLRDARHRR
jgi:hypothetical protein